MREPDSAAALPHAVVHGAVVLYRLFDVGYGIRLERAFALLASSAIDRPRPVREGASTIQIPNPPVTVALGVDAIPCAGGRHEAQFSARLFDFGVISLRARIEAPTSSWEDYASFARSLTSDPAWTSVFVDVRSRLLERIADAIERPGIAPVHEDYAVFRVRQLAAKGVVVGPDGIGEADLARLLLGETRPLAPAARKELLSGRFSYFDDDLAVLTWSSALVLDPDAGESDVEYVLEFANAQLLELRYHDAALDRELPRMYARIGEARRGFHVIGRRFSPLLVALQTRVADATEVVERIENSLEVTQDVFLARLYSTAIDIFGGRTWRGGIERKLAILRDTYLMLNAEAQALRGEVLEVVVVLLIALEIVLGFWRR